MIDGKVGGVVNFASNIGLNLSPLIFGPFVENTPMILIYVHLGVISISTVMLLSSYLIGQSLVARELPIQAEPEETQPLR